MSEHSPLVRLLRRARRRCIGHLLANHSAFALAVALGACVLLLLAGTQILDWYWPVVLLAAALALGFYRTRGALPSPYRLAQVLDHRLGLQDALSTAWHFRLESDSIIEAQRTEANRLAGTADLRRAMPFTPPRSFYAGAGLAVLAASLFGIRYGVSRSLDLRPSLVQIAFEGFLGSDPQAAAAKKKVLAAQFRDHMKQLGINFDPFQNRPGDLDPAPESAIKTVDTPEVNNPDNGDSSMKVNAKGETQQVPGEPSDDSTERGQSATGKSTPAADQSAAASENAEGQNAQPPPPAKGASEGNGKNAGENSSLMDKMRDAMSSLLAKMKMQPKGGDNRQSASNQSTQPSGRQKQAAGQKGQQMPGKPQDGAQSADADSEQQAQTGENAESAQGKTSGDHSADRQTSSDPKSGIGREDGDKSARLAEQQAAMGKISEILGKRAANVKGEIMVEVSPDKNQQLKTQYTSRRATHAEAGGEINRDEVPLAYQQYVQQYFEAVRKAPGQAAASGKTAR